MPLSAPNGESMSGGNPRRRHAGVSRPRRLREKVSATPRCAPGSERPTEVPASGKLGQGAESFGDRRESDGCL